MTETPSRPDGEKKPPLPAGNPAARLAQTSSAGVDLAANVVTGILLGWACIHFFPSTMPWGFLGFMALGIASGFWQLFRTQSRPTKRPPKDGKA